MLLSAVQKVFAEHEVERVLVACSGGIDSVVLTELAIELLGLAQVTVGHVDHAIREDSASDARWLEQWCETLGVRYLNCRLPPGPSDEAYLRTARYQALRAQKNEVSAQFILTAHHQDDQAETIIMNLIRGTNWPSLAGIAGARDDVLRPLLDVPKSEILHFARARRLEWRDDCTNREPHYLRNRIRKELLPLMETRYRPGLSGRLANLAREVRAVLDTAQSNKGKPELEADGKRVGKASEISNNSGFSEVVPHELPTVEIEKVAWREEKVPSDENVAVFDSAVVSKVYIRRHRPGDRIQPMGMTGRKKLQDVFVDAKVPREMRPWMVVLVDEQDRVLWVPGVVRSALAAVNQTTEEVWKCRTTGHQSCSRSTDG